MARRFCQTALALALLYAAALGAFAFARYRGADRPDLGGVIHDFHRWVRGLVPTPPPPPADPGALPPPRDPAAPVAPAPLPPEPTRQPLIAPAGR